MEPKSIEKNVPHTYNGTTKDRDEVIVDITVFRTLEDLETGRPSAVLKSTKVAHTMLTATMEPIVGKGPMVAILHTIPTKGGKGYVWRDASSEIVDHVAAYYKLREAELEAALRDVPDFG